jgi:hypothetical protein
MANLVDIMLIMSTMLYVTPDERPVTPGRSIVNRVADRRACRRAAGRRPGRVRRRGELTENRVAERRRRRQYSE